VGRPVFGRECDTPEARTRCFEFDADAGLLILHFADVYNIARDFLTSFHVSQPDDIAESQPLFEHYERAMCVYNLRDCFLRERLAVGSSSRNHDVHGQQDALAAADGAGFRMSGLKNFHERDSRERVIGGKKKGFKAEVFRFETLDFGVGREGPQRRS
jgi:hypothetical protein